MPNYPQLLFLASFLISFISLLILSNFLSSKLNEAGYDISRLILIGIPHSHNTHPNKMSTLAPSFLDVRQSAVAQFLTLLLAVASSAFIYLKFGRSGMSSFSVNLAPTSHPVAMI